MLLKFIGLLGLLIASWGIGFAMGYGVGFETGQIQNFSYWQNVGCAMFC